MCYPTKCRNSTWAGEGGADNVTEIINYDPRVNVDRVSVETYESGIIVECEITYLPYNISESMRLKFDEDNGFFS